MNNEVKYIIQGCLLTVFVITAFNAVKFLYNSSNKETSVINSHAVVIDGDDVNIRPVVPDFALPGYKLFQNNCAACHSINKRLVGPALMNVEERGPWSDRKQVYQWVHNPTRYMKADAYAAGLYKEYQVLMTAFPALSDKEIDTILDYIKEASKPYGYDAIACR